MKLFTFKIEDRLGNEIGTFTVSAENEAQAYRKVDDCLHCLSKAKLLK